MSILPHPPAAPVAVVVEVPGVPVPKGRPRFCRATGRTYTPAKTRKAEEAIAKLIHEKLERSGAETPVFPSGPIRVEILSIFPCPKGDHRARRPRGRRLHSKRPDSDNVAKAACDAASGLLWKDDAQVAELVSRKVIAEQGEAPRTIIVASRLEDVET